MVTVYIIFILFWSLLIQKSTYAIYDSNSNDGIKTRGFHRDPRISESIVMHHQYSQVASNRPSNRDSSEHSNHQDPNLGRAGRTSYTSDAENYIAQYGSECPPHATGSFPYLLNCRQFLNCWKGRGFIQSCAPGTVFNPDTRECDNPQKVVCLNYRSDVNSNNQFEKLQSADDSVQIASHPSPKPNVNVVQCSPESNGLEPHPFDCAKFLNCANGITYIQVCGPGTVFNPLTLVCDFPYNVDCSNRNGNAHIRNTSSESSVTENGRQHHHYQHNHGHHHGYHHGHRHNDDRGLGAERTSTEGSGRPYHNHHYHHNHHHQPDYMQPPRDPQSRESWKTSQTGNGSQWNQSQPDGGQFHQTWQQSPSSPLPSNRLYHVQPVTVNEMPQGTSFGIAGSTNKTTIYYAQPVDNYDDLTDYKSIENDQQKQIALGFVTPPDLHQNDSSTIITKQLTPSPSSNHNVVLSTKNLTKNYDSNLYGGLLPPSRPTQNTHRVTYSSTRDHLVPPAEQEFVLPTRSGLVPIPYGDLLPPLLDVQTTNQPDLPVLYPPFPPATKPTEFNETKIYRVIPIYPPIREDKSLSNVNSTPGILYSPSYSGISHTKSKPNDDIPPFSNEETQKKVIPIYNRSPPTTQTPTIRTSTYLPQYNHEFYKPSHDQNNHESDSKIDLDHRSDQVINAALKALFRPYFNRSGTITEDVVDNMDKHIMTLTKPKPVPPQDATEVEIIIAGEQDNLNQAAHHEGSSSADSGENTTEEPNHHRHGFHHNLHNPHHNHRDGWYPHHHSREFHRTHPNIRNPFATNDLEQSVSTKSITGTIDNRFDDGAARNPSKDQNPTLDTDKTTCQFDCENNKCIGDFQVCDGVNDCGNGLDEKQCEHIGYEVRLSSEEGKPHMGRVEVKVNGKWGYVCDDKFGMRAADVLCHELGFELGASEVRANSYYPPNIKMMDNNEVLFAMDEVDCLGNETSIRECNFKGWGVHDCSAEEVVGVVCKIPVMRCPPDYWLCKTSQECVAIGFLCDSVPDCKDASDESDEICNESVQYRLQGGDIMEGRVEVKYRGSWGTICDDDFGKKEAQVLCRTLGFFGEATIIKNGYGSGTGPIWMDQVSCFGNETALDQCSHWAWGEHNCNHSEDVSVRCRERQKNLPEYPTTVTTTKPIPEDPSEDADRYLYKMQRSSKAVNPNKRCGQINEHVFDEFDTVDQMARVVNGTRALRGHHPWQASIRAKGHSGKSSHWCGAILITQMHVLTAAHCLIGFPKGAYFIRMGDHYSKIAESSEVDIFIQNWYIHENFRKGHHMNNDIALIVLKSPVIFSDYIQPICLPSKDAKYEEGMNCTISGWGSIQSGISTSAPSNNLKAAHVPIISQAVCKEPYVYGDAITDGMFCAGYLDEGVDACDGDSGGPLACSTPNGETLYGIISWGQHCGQANKPGVYVKVSYYLDWIIEKILFSIKGSDEE